MQEVNPQYGPVDPGDAYSGQLLVYEADIARMFAGFVSLVGELYRAGRYLGAVDIGLNVTGLAGARSMVGLDPTVRVRDGRRATAVQRRELPPN